MNDAVIIICSTPYSKRLPRKCFMKICGKMVLEHILDRIKPLGIPVVLAIPKNIEKDDFAKYLVLATKYKLYMRSGQDNSPLHRMASIIKLWEDITPKYVIRITHDDILIDAQTIKELLIYIKEYDAGYCITPKIVEGAGVEVIATENLLYAADKIKKPVEDVSYFVKGKGLPNPKIEEMLPRIGIKRPYRLTLDYYEDYVVLENIFRQVGVDASVDKICEYLDRTPSLLNYNRLPEVTIYTCIKNGVRWLRPAIDSARGYLAEYIIVDDCSDDSSLHQILEFYGNDKMEIIINQENKGLASSSNIAVSKARGKYIMRIDADDILMMGAIEKMKSAMKESGAVICYANYRTLSESGAVINHCVSAKKHHHIGCALVNKRFLNELRFKEGIRHWDSLELYNRIKDRFPIAYIEEPLWYYRVHPGSLSRSNLEEREKCKPRGEK